MNLIDLTPAQLRKAADLKETLEGLHKQLAALSGPGEPTPLKTAKKKGGMSAAGKARIVAAQKARWAKVKAAKPTSAPKPAKKKFTMSASAKAKISAAAKARWAKIRAAKK
jgi:hypothetical protein